MKLRDQVLVELPKGVGEYCEWLTRVSAGLCDVFYDLSWRDGYAGGCEDSRGYAAFDSIRFNSIQFNSIQFDSIQFLGGRSHKSFRIILLDESSLDG